MLREDEILVYFRSVGIPPHKTELRANLRNEEFCPNVYTGLFKNC